VHELSNGVNRRGSIRRKPKGVQICCRRGAAGVGPDIAMLLRSISESGARLLVTSALNSGEEVEVEFRSASYPKVIRLIAEVVRCKACPGNVYCAAVSFQKRLNYAEFSRLT
jgi:hypothetical protein